MGAALAKSANTRATKTVLKGEGDRAVPIRGLDGDFPESMSQSKFRKFCPRSVFNAGFAVGDIIMST